MGCTIGFALGGSNSVTLFCTACVENSWSVALVARWSMITWFLASGAMVATYWSVFVTVVIAHAEITEIGMSNEARTTRTQAMMPLVRRARGRFLGASSPATTGSAAPCTDSGTGSVIRTPGRHHTFLSARPNLLLGAIRHFCAAISRCMNVAWRVRCEQLETCA